MSLIQEEMPHVVRRKSAKPFDVSTHTEKKVYSVLAWGTCPWNTCLQLIPKHEPGLSHILSNVCL